MTICVDLVMDDGELVRIECPNKFEEELYDALENAMKRGDWWSPSMYEGCSANYLGLYLGRVAMKRVIGML